jgi:hypothetical protein
MDKCIELNLDAMNEGKCVLTYNWGGQFKQYLRNNSRIKGRFDVAPTPGSSQVLDRETGELIPCDDTRCRHGTKHDDIGWVNRAPYLAFGRSKTFVSPCNSIYISCQ